MQGCRNVRILSIEIIFSLMKSGKLLDFIKRKKIFGVCGTLRSLKSLNVNCAKQNKGKVVGQCKWIDDL